MNKKIVMSLSVIAAVAAVVIGGTSAFFSDSETSTGNTFTAGAIDLKIDNTRHYNGMVCTAGTPVGDVTPYTWQPEQGFQPGPNQYPAVGSSCTGTWTLKDLVSEKFFEFGDIKPGDWGEDTISLHVDNNDAYACVDIMNMQDKDNSQTEPESQAVLDTDDMVSGELAEGLNFFAWADDGDNIFEGSANNEVPLFSNVVGPASDVLNGRTYTLADSLTGVLPGGSTRYIGLAWCAGTLTPTSMVNGGWTCDGASMGNEAQTDSVSADISFRVEQARNNGDFKCSDVTGPTVAASYATGFEPAAFSVGNINGQDGWEKTGSYDAAVVSNPVIADLQSLRISNAVTSGAFGDQTFAPELASGAGETGVGVVKHFEAEFKIATTEATEQPGLALSVSPDDGNGSRMSYLSFADEAGGVRVTFYDVTNAGPLPTVSSFNPTDLGLISRSTHTIKFVMDFVDGPSNDIVKIYIDGSLVHTGTSWENYFRYDSEQTGSGNVLSAVDTLIFRAGGTAVPANSGKGFLFDNVSLSSSSI